ncbi:metallophosphoesterase family protein [Halogeometricum sp. S1BR25-6]|uniref:Metallophosphoesterase family protein n=1 Tax=Halogeometricum salsisoli TaxID=2950536 RepID=A0ABU2GCV2_9EURY|nr:metallophosphoesterase [Halogeometricum sp. S1BR25-6]MDS0298129.1 metallophosphoesterase family protein [Halogeometricum sp. S1BR25-6]
MHDVTYRDRAAYLPFADALVVADLHVGRAEASNVEFPLGEEADLGERLAALVDAFDPAEVVFAGDLLHRFDGATVRAAEGVSDLVAVCRERGARPVVVRGNHDTALETAWDGDVHGEYALTDDPRTVVCHGHVAPEADASLYVVGHVHPAITIESVRRPCYLYGEGVHRGADVLVLPAFTRLAAGVPVEGLSGEKSGSPLVTDVDAFRPVVYDEDAGEVLSFPPLGEFRRML